MGGKGGGGPSESELQAQIQSNKAMADAYTKQAEMGLETAKASANAQIQAARTSAMAGIVGAAMAQNTTTEQIVRRLPVESGAATIQSYELAQKWNTQMEMTIAGYNKVAIDYELSGHKFNSEFGDAEWTSLYMGQKIKDTALSAANLIGIQSGNNPNGIPMTWEQYLGLNSLKRPEDMMKVDPAVKAQREAQYAQWKQQMNASGQGFVVNLFENPQLAGQSIEAMQGKQAALDPAMVKILQQMMDQTQSANPAGSIYSVQEANHLSASQRQQYRDMGFSDDQINQIEGSANLGTAPRGVQIKAGGGVKRDAQGKIIALDPTDPNIAGMLNPAELTQFGPLINTTRQEQGQPKMDLSSLGQDEKTKYSAQIKQLKELGIIDANNMINGGEILKMVPKDLQKAPEFNPYRELSQSELVGLQDQYNKGMNKVYDPKLIKQNYQGFGVTQVKVYNPDGSEAHGYMTGDLMLADGTTIKGAVLQGSSLQEWYDFQSLADGMGPTFPGMFAPRSNQEVNGIRDTGAPGAMWNGGTKGQPMGTGTKAVQGLQTYNPGRPPEMQNPYSVNPYAQENQLGGAKALPAPGGTGGAKKVQAPTSAATGGPATPAPVQTNTTPVGYEGAPLGAGGP